MMLKCAGVWGTAAIHGMSALTSRDTLTQGWEGRAVIRVRQSYSDTRVGGRAVIHGLSRDVRVALTSGDTLTLGWGGRAVIRGLSRDVRVTLIS